MHTEVAKTVASLKRNNRRVGSAVCLLASCLTHSVFLTKTCPTFYLGNHFNHLKYESYFEQSPQRHSNQLIPSPHCEVCQCVRDLCSPDPPLHCLSEKIRTTILWHLRCSCLQHGEICSFLTDVGGNTSPSEVVCLTDARLIPYVEQQRFGARSCICWFCSTAGFFRL